LLPPILPKACGGALHLSESPASSPSIVPVFRPVGREERSGRLPPIMAVVTPVLDHVEAQRRGKTDWYTRYEIRVALVQRAYGFDADVVNRQ
jgi:hypothetical protein